uniref:Carboxylic ester hydrolase n=1 Tax=Amblyomma triste TaxID=251400 RepID=A0A023GNE9_AMBTT
MWVILAAAIAAYCLIPSSTEDSDLIVHTTSGDVVGSIHSTPAGLVRCFRGIPYAEPPLGELRFKKPSPKKPWRGKRFDFHRPPMCPQLPARINSFFVISPHDPVSEDCLYLNVFAPLRNDSTLRPIIVYIHGGAFTLGGISMPIFNSAELAGRGDLIVVNIAYRLGALGFLSMGIEDAPGNMGLYDQRLALRWVNDNARAFGGDPDMITVMGQSAGAISVSMHLLSPNSSGLFRRAFLQSGSPFIRGFISKPEQATHRAGLLTGLLGCSQEGPRERSPSDVVACLRSRDFTDILNASESFNVAGMDGFFPVFSEDFVSPQMAARMQAEPNARDILLSVCESEGDFFMNHVLTNVNNIDDVDGVKKNMAISLVKVLLTALTTADTRPIIKHYFDPVTARSGADVVHAASDIIGDFLFGCPALKHARMLTAANASVHVFRFAEKASFVDWARWVRPTHADDILFSLGSAALPMYRDKASDADYEATENLIYVLSKFSRSGVPKVADGTSWPRFDDQDGYLHMRNGRNVPKKHFLSSTCEFWNNLQFPTEQQAEVHAYVSRRGVSTV